MSDDKKPMEIELKLLLPGPEVEPAIVAAMREQGYQMKELKEVKNVDTYLDTFDWSLLKKKLALRYRVAGGEAVYALKGMGGIENGIARRMEIEVALDKPLADPTAVPAKQIRELIDEIVYPRKLLEHMQIRTARRRYRTLTPEGAKIELAFDTASFSLRGLHKPRGTRKLHELEAELLDGPAAALSSLSSLLTGAFGYPPATTSKFEAALGRFHILPAARKLPERDTVRPDDRLDLAVRKILAHQLNRLREQLPGIDRDIDTEFVHQARVATRRMRSALRLFHEALPPRTGAFLAGELQWLGGLLGAVRDLDVFLLSMARFKEKLERFPTKQQKSFARRLEEHRRAPRQDLCLGLVSPRYRNFERRFLRFLKAPLPARPRTPLARKPVREAAPSIINERLEAVIEQGQAVLREPRLKEFHRLRILMKRLRYACEFMAPAYAGALGPFIEHTVALQDCLGEIQDSVFTRKFINDLFEDWKGKLVDPELVFILGEICQLQREIARERQAKFGKIWERFTSAATIGQLKGVLSVPARD